MFGKKSLVLLLTLSLILVTVPRTSARMWSQPNHGSTDQAGPQSQRAGKPVGSKSFVKKSDIMSLDSSQDHLHPDRGDQSRVFDSL